MIKNKLILLGTVTVVVIIAASVLVKSRAPQTEKDKIAFFPGLAEKIESVNHIAIVGYADQVNLSRHNDTWGIDEFDGYPALPDKVKRAVLGAADLNINAPKTALPRLYHRLGVDGPEAEDTSSILLTLKDKSKNKLAEIIVGNPRRSSAAQSSPGLYVRKPDAAQSYLVDGVLDITAYKTDWMERSLFDIPADTVKSIRIDHPDGDTFTLFKQEKGQENFALESLPPGKKIAPELIINRFGSLLQDLQISGARSEENLQRPDDSISVRLKTFDGIIANMVAFTIDDIAYAAFKFGFDERVPVTENTGEKRDAVQALVDDLNSRTSAWWFEIPQFQYDIVNKRSDTVMRDEDDVDLTKP